MSKETAKAYANKAITTLDSSEKNHFAWRYLFFHKQVEDMGGFANFSHYICNKEYEKHIKRIKSERDLYKGLLKDTASLLFYIGEYSIVELEKLERLVCNPDIKKLLSEGE